MQKYALSLLLMLAALAMLAGCGDDVADDPKLSEESKAIVEEVGGPFTVDEFEKFLADLPKIPGLSAESREDIGDAEGAALSEKIMNAVEAQGWDGERFMYVYSHVMTMVSAEQMSKMADQVAAQMEGMPEEQKKMMEQMLGQQMGGKMDALQAELDQSVPSSEQDIVRDRLDDVYKALGI